MCSHFHVLADLVPILSDNSLGLRAPIHCRGRKSAIVWKWTLTLRSHKTLAYLPYRLEYWASYYCKCFVKKYFVQTNSVPGHAKNMLETSVGSRNMPFINNNFQKIRILCYIKQHSNGATQNEVFKLTQSLVGRLCHLGIEEICFKFLLTWSGWGCTWQDAWSHSFQILFFTVPTGPNSALTPLVFVVFITIIPTKMPPLFKLFSL
jgi:hypothetical protein